MYLPMGKKIGFTVKESVSELKSLRRKQSTLSSEKRIVWLQQFHSKKPLPRKNSAANVNISLSTQERWIKEYMKGGIEGFISPIKRNRPSKIITEEIHEGLAKRVNSSELPFLGYWDAVDWVKEEFGVEIKYHWLRKYLIQHFKTKLKSPRKSHYKKDDQAIEAFLKTTGYARPD